MSMWFEIGNVIWSIYANKYYLINGLNNKKKKQHSRYIIATITESHNLHGYHSRWNIFISDILTMFTIQLWGCQVFEICALLMNNMKQWNKRKVYLFYFYFYEEITNEEETTQSITYYYI